MEREPVSKPESHQELEKTQERMFERVKSLYLKTALRLETVAFDQQVKERRLKGLTVSQSAQELQVKNWRVKESLSRLINSGQIEKIKRGGPKGPRPETVAFDQKVKDQRLKPQRLNTKQIVQELKKQGIQATEHRVRRSVHRSIKAGEIERRKRGGKPGESRDKVFKFLLKRQKETPNQVLLVNPAELGSKFPISDESARQYIRKFRKAHPEVKIFLPKEVQVFLSQQRKIQVKRLREAGFPNKEIARRLKLTLPQVRYYAKQLIKEGIIENRLEQRIDQITPRDKQVLRLRQNGKSYRKIAKILKITIGQVNGSCQKLIRMRLMERQKFPRPKEEIMKFDERIEELSRGGLSRRKIAKKLWEENPEIGVKTWLSRVLNSFTRRKRKRERKLAQAT